MGKLLQKEGNDSEEAPQFQGLSWFGKGNKFTVMIINEDLSYGIYRKRKPVNHQFKIGKVSYMLIARCVLRAKKPLIAYFRGNPWPIGWTFQKSSHSSLDYRDADEIRRLTDTDKDMYQKVLLDADAVNIALNTTFFRSIYAGAGVSFKIFIVILIVIFCMVLVTLHLTGVIDLVGFFTSQ